MKLIFQFILVLVLVLNGVCLALQLGMLRRRQPWPKAIGVGLVIWTVLVVGIFILQHFCPVSWRAFLRHWLYLPISVGMIWNLLFVPAMIVVVPIIALALRLFRPVKAAAPPPSPDDLSRRKFVYLLACGAAPATALGMGVHSSLIRHDLRVRDFRIGIAGLPPELEGFTIAHVSDLHSGIFCGPSRLQIISSATNDLKADLIVVTGDIINDHMSEFAPALVALQSMGSRYGTYLCEGNHDVIPGPGLMVAACAENNLRLLWDRTAEVPVENRRLLIGGLPWMQSGTPEMVRDLYPERREGDVRLLLAHHPNLFDAADSADLVLSGHTHGGQIMVGPVGFGPLFFKYWSGAYTRGNTTMIVSNGCGDWFPYRIGAPAEIGLLRLTAKV